MAIRPFHTASLLTFPLVVLMLAGCQSEPRSELVRTSDRPAADALDRTTADLRASRISEVEYDVLIDVAASDTELVGEAGVSFELSDAGSDLTLDFGGGSVVSTLINDVSVMADYNGFFLTLPAEHLVPGENRVHIAYRRPYGRDGTGLHRFVDPEDDRVYLHSYLWPYYANRLLPSFDQPSLKAVFRLRVRAPEGWVVVSTSPGLPEAMSGDTELWTFSPTPKISTYMFSLHAGQYTIWNDETGNIPLRLMARRSLAQYVEVDEWFEITQNGMTFFQDYFDIPYPFEKYDQLIVPEFNIGGMENAAAVSYSESYVHRQESDRAQRERRSGTVLHELAHMWFGDLVTHEWWNGMWLNESFATQMETLAQLETTEFTDMWHGYFTKSKKRAYARDSRVTTHPIEMPVDSTDQFTTLFDAITYEKGGSALKQLMFRVGAENYRRGVAAYLKEHAFSTTRLADFIRHQSEASDIDLTDWSDEWLLTPGFNTLRAETRCDNGELLALEIVQTADDAQPQLRTHQLKVALYDRTADGDLTVAHAVTATIGGERTPIDVPAGQPCPVLVNPNFEDWTYAKTAISDADSSLLASDIGRIQDPLSRSQFLAALRDRALSGDTPVARYTDLLISLAEDETNVRVLQQVSTSLSEAVALMQRLRPQTDAVLPARVRRIEQLALDRAATANSDDLQQLWFNTFLGVASSDAALSRAAALLDGTERIPGIDISSDIRWKLLVLLSRYGADDIDARLQAEIERDPSDQGQRSLLTAQAAQPDSDNKKRWVDELLNPSTLTSLARQRAVMSGLFPAAQTELQLTQLPALLDALPAISQSADPYFLRSFGSVLFTPVCRNESNALLQNTLDDVADQLSPTSLRFLREAHQADVECQRLRVAQ